jgi:hypothetical protein
LLGGAAVALAVAGCGGGGGGGGAGSKTTTTVASQPASATTTSPSSGATTVTSLDERQSGDETPISTQALFTGRAGVISPSRIRVPPFIAVTVVLRSADGRTYAIEVNGRGMATNGRAELKLPGLRAGDRYVVTNKSGSPKRLVIVANAEPGP